MGVERQAEETSKLKDAIEVTVASLISHQRLLLQQADKTEGGRSVYRAHEPGRGTFDEELLTRINAGDDQALAILYDRYSKVVYSVALRILGNPANAEEVLQDIFLRLWRNPPKLIVAENGLSGWMAVVSRNRSISALRKMQLIPLDDVLLTSSLNLEKQTEDRILYATVMTLVDELPAEQRMILDMAFFDGMSHSEIAAATGYPLGTVKTRIRRAIFSLKRCLGPCRG